MWGGYKELVVEPYENTANTLALNIETEKHVMWNASTAGESPWKQKKKTNFRLFLFI